MSNKMSNKMTVGQHLIHAAVVGTYPSFEVIGGLSKREYFAVMSLAGLRAAKLISDPGYAGDVVHPGSPAKLWSSSAIAQQAVRDADALVKTLNLIQPAVK